jgi:hypothetical protein
MEAYIYNAFTRQDYRSLGIHPYMLHFMLSNIKGRFNKVIGLVVPDNIVAQESNSKVLKHVGELEIKRILFFDRIRIKRCN